jgi:chaperone modulatory protein CbpM
MALERVRRMRRLMRDFEAGFTAAAMMMELIDEIARLRRMLDRAGISWRDEP